MGLFKKEFSYDFKVDLGKVVGQFEDHLKSDGWNVQTNVQGDRGVVQAQKGGILRDIIAAERALTFTFDQTSDKLRVTVGVGKWLQNIGVMVLETLFLSEIFLTIDIPEMLWTEHVEKKLMTKLEEIISSSKK